MERSKHEKRVSKFTASLREMVECTYCLGGASEDEIRLAHADFLMNLAHHLISQIDGNPECPPTR